MPHDPSDRRRRLSTDREYYADLWGTNPDAVRRRSLADLRSRSAFVALFAAVLLLGQLAYGSLRSDAEERNVIGPAGTDPSAPGAGGQASSGDAGTPSGPEAATEPDVAAVSTDPKVAEQPTPAPAGPPPTPVLLDADMVNELDDSLALAMLHSYEQLGTIDLLAVTLSAGNDDVAAYADAVNTFYSAGDTPIGVIKSGQVPDTDGSFHTAIAADTERFGHDLTRNIDAEDAVALMRRSLAEQPDNSVVVVATGYSTNLVQLLRSEPDGASELGGMELVTRKVKILVNMAGDFSGSRAEFNVAGDPASARIVYAEWPSPIVTADHQVGTATVLPGQALAGLPRPEANPILAAFELHGPSVHNTSFPFDQPGFDLAAALQAVEPDGGYLAVSEPGTVAIDDRSITTFTPAPDGNVRILHRPDQAAAERIVQRYVELVSMVPTG